MDAIIVKIYREELLKTYIRDYVETENDIVKNELYEKIRSLLIELNMI
jgi:hypothetical protein